MGEVLLKCQALVQAQAKKRRVTITFPQFEIPCFVKGDRTKVKQVLLSLLINAIKYNKPGGAVAVGCTLSPNVPDSIRISVRDTGKGLLPEQLVQLFQPFNRLGQEAGEEEGTGLGLVVSKQLVEVMGGSIGADSTVGVGSVFWIELVMAAAPPLIVSKPESPRPVLPQVQGVMPLRTVLYIEDNSANLELIKQLIARRPDLHLRCATDGETGIASARLHQPDVIVMDINLPGMSGSRR